MAASAKIDLSHFQNTAYHPGASWLKQVAWFVLGIPLLRCPVIPSSAFRRALLQLFGARIGRGAVLKPGIRVKYPWNLTTGDNCWIGEDAWIDNLTEVTLGNNVCISQGAYLCTGNHDWADPAFGLIVRPIRIDDGAWVGARASLTPGVVINEGAVVAFGAVVMKNVPAYEVHAGNPATFVRPRHVTAKL
jgi:putative colanic acid biosynthesis acetyltransferase WcaF